MPDQFGRFPPVAYRTPLPWVRDPAVRDVLDNPHHWTYLPHKDGYEHKITGEFVPAMALLAAD